jgi:hypothetical protein
MMSRNTFWLLTAASVVGPAFLLWVYNPAYGYFYLVVNEVVGVAYLAAGLVACRRQPPERIGLLFMNVGFLWYLGALGDLGGAVFFGVAFGSLYEAGLAHLALAWPSGHLRSGRQRALVIGEYAWSVVSKGSFPIRHFGTNHYMVGAQAIPRRRRAIAAPARTAPLGLGLGAATGAPKKVFLRRVCCGLARFAQRRPVRLPSDRQFATDSAKSPASPGPSRCVYFTGPRTTLLRDT